MADNRFAVPLEELEEAHVPRSEQVASVSDPKRYWDPGAGLVHPFGDGASGDADGD